MRRRSSLFITISLALTMVANSAVAFTTSEITRMGPGDRIHGMDISYWQHPNGKSIDFKTMYAAGIRFVLIKGGDSQTKADAQALKYLKVDRPAAQNAGIYTGFYFYSYMPDSTDKAFIIRDAQAQAQKAVWRLATIGGYTENDLPIALALMAAIGAIPSDALNAYMVMGELALDGSISPVNAAAAARTSAAAMVGSRNPCPSAPSTSASNSLSPRLAAPRRASACSVRLVGMRRGIYTGRLFRTPIWEYPCQAPS